MSEGTRFSVVVPVYGCEPCLRELHARLRAALSALGGSFEMVFVDDCGKDRSWDVLEELAAADAAVRAIRLSRNFGQHAAITAGLAESTGEWVVVMDCDLQEPPEEIPRLWEAARQGFDVVLGRRRQRQHAWPRRLAARLYFRFLSLAVGRRLEGEYGSFSMISRKVVREFLRFKDRDRQYLFIVHWLGFRATTIEYDHAARRAGRSAYSLRALMGIAFAGLFAHSTLFLRWIVTLGLFVSAGGLALAAYFLYRYLAHDTVPPGFTSLAVLIVVLGGMGIFTTGVTGLYVGRTFEQVKERPLYVVDERRGGGGSSRP